MLLFKITCHQWSLTYSNYGVVCYVMGNLPHSFEKKTLANKMRAWFVAGIVWPKSSARKGLKETEKTR